MSEAKILPFKPNGAAGDATQGQKEGELVILKCVTRLPIPVDRVLNSALSEGLTEVVVLGYDAKGDFYFAASEPDGPSVLWLLEWAKRSLLNAGDLL